MLDRSTKSLRFVLGKCFVKSHRTIVVVYEDSNTVEQGCRCFTNNPV